MAHVLCRSAQPEWHLPLLYCTDPSSLSPRFHIAFLQHLIRGTCDDRDNVDRTSLPRKHDPNNFRASRVTLHPMIADHHCVAHDPSSSATSFRLSLSAARYILLGYIEGYISALPTILLCLPSYTSQRHPAERQSLDRPSSTSGGAMPPCRSS